MATSGIGCLFATTSGPRSTRRTLSLTTRSSLLEMCRYHGPPLVVLLALFATHCLGQDRPLPLGSPHGAFYQPDYQLGGAIPLRHRVQDTETVTVRPGLSETGRTRMDNILDPRSTRNLLVGQEPTGPVLKKTRVIAALPTRTPSQSNMSRDCSKGSRYYQGRCRVIY
uniref:Uncharacterized protein n=1 Tax=Timema genevievae TaxID=629358 RepID=A0A7R9K0J7_TIMGE|nr:unnamed protein product [Timema genevievae]